MGKKENKNKTTAYLLREIPTELWDKAKHRAVDESTSLRRLILVALEDYLNNK